MDEDEAWRIVEGFPDYMVSSLGRVISYKRLRPQQLAPSLSGSGYAQAMLCGPGKRRMVTIHLLVLETFIGPRPPGMVIRHIDGDRHNNRLANLTYGTHSENMRDKVRHGRHHMANRTSCVNGHAFTEESTGVDHRSDGSKRRRCRTCNTERARRYAAR